MNAFWASENREAFIALSAPPSRGITAENSSQKRSSFAGSEHPQYISILTISLL
jgi:hypothetical protein